MIYQLKPITDITIWGGKILNEIRGLKDTKGGTSWEISFHPYGINEVIGLNTNLKELLDKDPKGLIGDIDKEEVLRLAYLDADEWLSVQLHPNNDYALNNGYDYGKFEAWYIIDAKPNAKLMAGTTIESKEELIEAIESGNIEEKMIYHPVKKGDFIYIPANALHALGKDILAIEISTNSNTTFRVYDYKRKDKDGNLRELHLKQVVDCVDLSLLPTVISSDDSVKNELIPLTQNEYFEVYRVNIDEKFTLNNIENDAWYVTILNKGLEIETIKTKLSENLLVSAKINSFTIKGNGSILLSRTTK
ncbi:MAG: hypothetical protein GX368_06495 [Erysipelotrichaceae bacterium]|jgi:mannose-6-phosphate isomerase|nr:hypothetical protein [Erysipelotrichaceae bacterium]